MFKIENPDEILEWDTNKLWATIQLIIFETGIEPEELDNIKTGIRTNIPISYIANEWYTELPSKKKVKIQAYGIFDLQLFIDEKEQRNNMMRKVIYENLTDEGTIMEPRIK